MLLVSFKTYKEATGEGATNLARQAADALREVASRARRPPRLVVCPQLVDLRAVVGTLSGAEGVEVWTQHLDAEERGRATGWCPPVVAREAGARGTMLGHAEHKLPWDALQRTVGACHRAGLEVLVWANSLDQVQRILTGGCLLFLLIVMTWSIP